MDNINNKRKEAKQLLLLAALTGKTMLKNGAETYRVEDTIERICKSRMNIKYADAFVTPTGIFVSLEYEGEMMTYLIRVKTIKIDLNKIDLLNQFSREFVNSTISPDEGIAKLKKINKMGNYTPKTKMLFGSLACAFFSLLFGGTFLDFLVTYIISLIVLITINKIDRYKMTFFVNNFIGAALASFLSVISTTIGFGRNMDIIIIGSIMSLVPGVAITNALRDTISGDFVSGLSRGMEAIFSALAIAFGVGFVLNIYYKGLI
ncbi:threonine/serine ThrE exporter family protein [Clostridium sp. Cult3]|uniref:threonine/serine ThrE exporter family protein n=1 Tax=Clostridium sp. Cult3 TaxID=2079004 RepID=UPI001F1BE0DA|nr:threonine/serine exporter family protein [Clostridium sp. Cult3]MCF6461367.1 threonine/serine exporter [Clostridium sp. Cult3]